jgi:GTP pyrophosphokinase
MLEIQIRTKSMHQTAENGIAGHWLYKQGPRSKNTDTSVIDKLKNLGPKQAESLKQQEDSGSSRFLEDIKKELLKDSIYVFTPQGKIIELPAGATPLDFAYHVHSAIGDHCLMAKADGAVIPLSAELKNTQVIEIVTGSASHPNLNWLNMVKTQKARSKIRTWLLENDETALGKAVVSKRKDDAEKRNTSSTQELKQGETQSAELPNQKTRLQEVTRNENSPVFKIRVGDEKNMLIRFARCCNPVLGDPIVGYVSRGRGITIHRKDCPNTSRIDDFADRTIETQWENASVPVRRFKVEARYREDLFAEIEGAVRKFQGHLIEGKLEESSANRLTGYFTIQLENPDDVKKVLKHIRGIPAVSGIQSLN